ncbi:GID complex subunit containing RING finger motif, partial [Tilletia horrida]
MTPPIIAGDGSGAGSGAAMTAAAAAAAAAATAATGSAPALDAILLLEQPFAHVPYDQLTTLLRTQQRLLARELDLAQSSLLHLASTPRRPAAAAAAAAEEHQHQQQQHQNLGNAAADQLDASIKRLRALKRRLAQLNAQTKTCLTTAAARYAHLHDLHAVVSTADPAFQSWSATRLNRILVDYMLRHGAKQAAAQLTASARIPSLVDTALFAEIDKIEASLYPQSTSSSHASAPATFLDSTTGDTSTTTTTTTTTEHCARALAWCAENRPALEAVGSRLEFDLRMQVYIELARTRTPKSLRDAIVYLRTYLLPVQHGQHHHHHHHHHQEDDPSRSGGAAAALAHHHHHHHHLLSRTDAENDNNNDDGDNDDDDEAEAREGEAPTFEASRRRQVSRALGLLACPPSSPAYADLYHPDRWATLRAAFRSCALRIHSLPPQPMLHIALSAGLSSLKVPACYSRDEERERQARREAESVLREPANAGRVGETERAVRRAVELAGRGAMDVSIPAPPAGVLPTSTSNSTSTSTLGAGATPAPALPGLRPLLFHEADADNNNNNNNNEEEEEERDNTPPTMSANDTNPDCPICEADGLGTLAREVPWSHHENSTIVCRLGGHVMAEDDPPMCLPNGRVYSRS